MILLSQYIFFIGLGAIMFSYIIYPLLLQLLAAGKKPNQELYTLADLPSLSILIAAHNEEKVIEEKLLSIFNGNYPLEKLEVFVGSDNSSDKTNEIVMALSRQYPSLKLVAFTQRTGKVKIINQLAATAKNPILIITDANVIFEKETLVRVAEHFKNPSVGLVDTNMLHKGLKKEGISHEENFYIRGEVSNKYNEGKIWGTMMGPFGGCYAVKKEYFSPVPENFLVDDFFINMKVLEKGGKAITEVNALVYEDVSNDIKVEFRRKIRIATGSFQNLFYFLPLLFRFNAVSFCFFSHKVLRWFGPSFLLLIYICSFILGRHNEFYVCAFLAENGILVLIGLDYILQKAGIHIHLLRLMRHFFFTNLALFIGMFRAIGGVSSSVWQPTQRFQ